MIRKFYLNVIKLNADKNKLVSHFETDYKIGLRLEKQSNNNNNKK